MKSKIITSITDIIFLKLCICLYNHLNGSISIVDFYRLVSMNSRLW